MTDVAALVVDNLAIWTGATERRSGAGRGGGKRLNLYGIERLRALILDLAVRGKLVPQDSGDEPASILSKSLHRQRSTNRNARKTFENPHPKPFDIAEGWAWVQVSDIGHDLGSAEPSSEFTYIDVGAIDQKKGIIDSPSVLSADDAPSRARRIVELGTVLYSTVRPYLLNIAVVDEVFDPSPIASTAFAVIQPYDGVITRYIYHYLRSPTFVAYVEGCQTGIAYPAINDRQFFSAWFPLPPTSEQERIVAKIDELMTLCDEIGEESAVALEAHQRLVECLLATLVDSSDASDLASNWSRLEAHFDTLFTTEESIEALKRTVLELAMRGKLVPQDSQDEPASELLRRIAKERARTARREKINFEIPHHQEAAELPSKWCLVPLLCLGVWAIGSGFPKAEQGLETGSYFFLKVSDMNLPGNEKYMISSNNLIDDEGARRMQAKIHPPGTVIFPKIGGAIATNKRRILTRKSAIDNNCLGITFFGELSSEWAYLLLRSIDFSQYQTGTAVPALQQGVLERIPVGLPPLAEQYRIVAQVDALMALCDSLKTSLAEASETQKHLADAIMEKAAA